MKLKQKTLPTFLLLTQDRAHIQFFKTLIAKLKEHTLIRSKDEEDAFDDLKRHRITLIIIDSKTPDLDTSSLCEKVRTLSEYSKTPILIITGQLKKQVIQPLLKAGATDFLLAPLDEAECLIRIEITNQNAETHQKISTLAPFISEQKTPSFSLKNRTIFNSRAINIIDLAKKEGSSLALILIEIDQYKSLKRKESPSFMNDVESFLHSMTRKQDLLFSQNNGKFITLLPKTSMRAAEFIAENMQEALNTEKRNSHYTLSMGLAEIGEIAAIRDQKKTFYLDRLMQLAEERLTLAKEKGNMIISR